MKSMTWVLYIAMFLNGVSQSAISDATKPTAEELLTASDRSRGAAASLEGITWTAKLTSIDASEDGEKTEVTYAIKVRGDDALAEVTEPARKKGEVILFNRRTLWFYKQGLKKPVSVSARQKLMGQAANGDIASTQYARDYSGELAGEEMVHGESTYKLELKAKDKSVTYDRIRYYISKSNRVGVRAEFLTVSGELFKIAEFKYGNQIEIKGSKYPFVSEMTISDASLGQSGKDTKNVNQTIIEYRDPKITPIATGIFNVNNFGR